MSPNLSEEQLSKIREEKHSAETSPVQRAVEALNDAFQRDPKAIWTIINAYTPCNELLADHPTVQVLVQDVENKETYTVGAMGLLNGVVEAITGHRVCYMYEEAEGGKRKLVGFDIYQPTVEQTV